MMNFTAPEINFICIFAGDTKAETIENIMDDIPNLPDRELKALAEQSIIKLDRITKAEFTEMNFSEQFSDEYDYVQ